VTEIKIYYDHCGKELNKMHDYSGTEVGITDFMDADLCVACINELQDLVKKFISKRSEQQCQNNSK
jgi:hypothetical protein